MKVPFRTLGAMKVPFMVLGDLKVPFMATKAGPANSPCSRARGHDFRLPTSEPRSPRFTTPSFW